MDIPDFTKLSNHVFEVLNKLRTDPRSFIPELTTMKTHFKSNEYRNPSLDYSVWTEEGVAAVEDAIQFLLKASGANRLERDPALDSSAQKLIDLIGPMGYDSHGEGKDSMEERVKAAKGDNSCIAENISLGWGIASEIVLQLLIDDGAKQRPNRLNLFSNKFTNIGIAAGQHKSHSYACVLDFWGKKQSSASFDKYEIDKNEWPPNAISLFKHLESEIKGNMKHIKLTYEFTLNNGQKAFKEKVFQEPI